jgi:hypothetical protein
MICVPFKVGICSALVCLGVDLFFWCSIYKREFLAWQCRNLLQCKYCSVRLYADLLSHPEFRVALHEDANRMNASALAIVFAPCILRTNKIVPAQDSLHDIGRQTQCIETIVSEQLRKVRSTLADIDTLDTACHTATHRLSSLRSSKV